MDAIKEFISKYSFRRIHKTKRICSILNDLGIHYFWHYRISSDGSFFVTSNQTEIMHRFVDNGLHLNNPFYTNPKHFVSAQFYTRSVGTQKYIEGAELMKGQAKIDNHYLVIRKPTEDICEGFGFASDPSHKKMEEIVISSPFLLQNFIDFYKGEMASEIRYLIDQRVSLLPLLNKNFFEKNATHLKIHLLNSCKERFLKAIHQGDPLIKLTKTERRCLHDFLEGMTAKETAKGMSISFRTVETHFENIKDKLNVNHKRELLKYKNFMNS